MTSLRSHPKARLPLTHTILAAALTAAALTPLAAPLVRAQAGEVAQALADCQAEDKVAELRARACTLLINTASVEGHIRAEALLNRGIVQMEATNADAAIADFTAAIALNPEYPAIYAHRAEAYQDTGQLDLALTDLGVVIRLLPEDADGYADRGEVHLRLGDRDKAVSDFRAALKLEPGNEQAREGLRGLGLR